MKECTKLPEILNPCIPFPGCQVLRIVFVKVGFLFERDISVSLKHPFHDIPQVKGQNEHFLLLLPVYVFMVQDGRVRQPFGMNEYPEGGKCNSRELP